MWTPSGFSRLSRLLPAITRIGILLLFTVLLSGIAAAEMLTGRVTELDDANLSFVLEQACSEAAGKDKRPVVRRVIVTLAADYRRPCGNRRLFPGCVRPGNVVRVRGRFSGREKAAAAGEAGIFIATEIRGRGPDDPTGVRFRIGRGCRFPRHRQGAAANGSAAAGKGQGDTDGLGRSRSAAGGER